MLQKYLIQPRRLKNTSSPKEKQKRVNHAYG